LAAKGAERTPAEQSAGSALPSGADTLSVLVPAYNEERDVREALVRLVAVLDDIGLPYEVVVVSDGSTDDTVGEAERVGSPAVRVLSYEPNRGKGHAIRHAWEHCSGRYVAFIDADLDLHPDGIRSLLALVRDGGADAAVGSKIHPDSEVVYPRLRRFQSQVFRAIVRARFTLDVSDTQTGLKVFRREVLEAVMPLIESDGFTLDLELLVFANDDGFRIVEGPIELDYGFSSTTGARAVLDMLKEMQQVAVRRRALKRSGRIGSPRHPRVSDATRRRSPAPEGGTARTNI
jgi:glycosyltransferase involved in cell wall biosynthesis